MVELLAGPLVGAAITDKLGAKNWGNLLLAIDPDLLGDREEIKQRVQVRRGRGMPSSRKGRGRGGEGEIKQHVQVRRRSGAVALVLLREVSLCPPPPPPPHPTYQPCHMLQPLLFCPTYSLASCCRPILHLLPCIPPPPLPTPSPTHPTHPHTPPTHPTHPPTSL
jgi:hypothetical protein